MLGFMRVYVWLAVGAIASALILFGHNLGQNRILLILGLLLNIGILMHMLLTIFSAIIKPSKPTLDTNCSR